MKKKTVVDERFHAFVKKRKNLKIGSYLLEFKLFQYDPHLGQVYTYICFILELN